MDNLTSKLLLLALLCFTAAPAQTKQQLTALLGPMPPKPELKVDTLEVVSIDNGYRYKLKWLAEKGDSLFHSPDDYLFAYLFVPDAAKTRKLPGMVAIHQDGAHNYLGYLEPAGIAGDTDQHYGIELYRRDYIVICPLRFLHGERRRIAKPDTLSDVFEEAERAEQHRVAQLLMRGRNLAGKETYDLMLATNILCSAPGLDKNRIGAIGHSAGGYVLAYFMFADKRIKAGASSCGVFELVDWYTEDAPKKRDPLAVLPGLANTGRTSDYVGMIAPRPFLMTRGYYEWGRDSDRAKLNSRRHAEGTGQMYNEAMEYYSKAKAPHNLKVIYFDEAGGNHYFPPKVKEEVYAWLDSYLKK